MTRAIPIKTMMLGEGLPKICVPLTGTNREKLLSEAAEAKAAAPDVVEWRADFFGEIHETEKVQEMLQVLSGVLENIPILFTIRTAAEGGNLSLSPQEYASINLCAAAGGADLVDVEVFQGMEEKKALIRKIHASETGNNEKQARKTVVIASSHDFQKTDSCEKLLERFQLMNQTGADVLKMAVMPETFGDVTAIMEATSLMTAQTEKPLISMSMGALGVISRITGKQFGSALTFATVGAASAPGQIPVSELRPMLRTLNKEI